MTVPFRFSFSSSHFPFPRLTVQNKDSTGADKLSPTALGDYYTKMTEDFPIVSIEDGFDQVCTVIRHKWWRSERAGVLFTSLFGSKFIHPFF